MDVLGCSNPFGGAVYYEPVVDSTMHRARVMVSEGQKPGFVVVAGFQQSGRCRISGRRWESAPGESLMFTVALPKDRVVGRGAPLPMIAALALATLIEQKTTLHPLLKWPNDLLLDGKKVSGILCESYGAVAAVGIGLNVAQKSLPLESREGNTSAFGATSLLLASGMLFEPLSLLPDLLAALDAALSDPLWHRRCSDMLYLRGEEITLLDGDPNVDRRVSGRLVGIGRNGELLLDTGSGEPDAFFSAEILFPRARDSEGAEGGPER